MMVLDRDCDFGPPPDAASSSAPAKECRSLLVASCAVVVR